MEANATITRVEANSRNPSAARLSKLPSSLISISITDIVRVVAAVVFVRCASFTPLAQGLGLKMLTPESFLDAISEGSDPTVADKTTIDEQIQQKQIKIYVFNSQNSTPDVQQQVTEAKAEGIPVTTVTETLAPANLSFQAWQVKELQGIDQALHQATGK